MNKVYVNWRQYKNKEDDLIGLSFVLVSLCTVKKWQKQLKMEYAFTERDKYEQY